MPRTLPFNHPGTYAPDDVVVQRTIINDNSFKSVGVDLGRTKLPTIGYLTTDWAWGTDPLQPNGCAWYRCVLPGVELEKRGWVCGVGIPGYNEKDGFGMVTGTNKAVHGWDIIVMKLVMHRDVLINMDRAAAMGQKVVVDVDDFFDGLASTNRAFTSTDPIKSPDNNREIYAEIIKKSFAIICSTQFLFDYYSKIHKNVFLVRNSIDLNRYPRKNHMKVEKRKTTIGWVGATPWRSGDLEELSGFLNNYLVANNLNFHHSGDTQGAPTAASQLMIDEKLVSKMGLSPISDYPKLFQNIDIGIVPLRDIEFNKAKSFIKGLEYVAAGIPFVASPSPEYKLLFDAGIGRIANTPDEWMYHFDELRNRKMRRDEAQSNLEAVSEFSIEKRGDDWEATMQFILEQSI
jgi:hypothetical protein